MNIALTHDSMRIGGISQQILNLGGYLVAQGHEVTVVSYEEGEWWARYRIPFGWQGFVPLPVLRRMRGLRRRLWR